MKTLARLWRGQYGLAKTWWLFGVLGTALLNLVSGPLNAVVASTPADGIGGVALVVAAVLVAVVGVCYGAVVTVGIVRAAMAYPGRRLWSWLALAVTAIAWVSAVTFVAM